MSQRLPFWVRTLLGLNRCGSIGVRAITMVRDEILCAGVPASRRGDVIAWMYSKQTAYLEGSPDFAAGLHDWERQAITGPLFRPGGRVLLGAAGGGRELVSLAGHGFQVVAFEPSNLVDGAKDVAARHPDTAIVRASYADLVTGVERQSGPLAPYLSTPFDAAILGWGSLSHVTTDEERQALFRALRRVVPAGPVLFSFIRDMRGGRLERLRRPLQIALRPIGAEVGSRLRFSPAFGFVRPLGLADVEALATATGYHLLSRESPRYGNALFLPAVPPARPGNPPATAG